MTPSHGPKTGKSSKMPRTGSHPQKQYFFLCHGFPAAPGVPRAAPRVLGTVASGKNVWFKIARPQFQRDFFYLFSVVAKKRKSLPPPPSETDRKAVGKIYSV